jgi:hypothetical protein
MQLKRPILFPNSLSSAQLSSLLKKKWGNDTKIMPPFYKSEAILSSGLTSWKMEPFPINSPAL